ncbi:MAG: FAD-dependent oxidoreductase [Saprospiraceae bacterium]
MDIDFIIVGQGIAGTLLASALEDLGKTFVIIDDKRNHAASRLAAGLINPITGRRFVKSWNYDELENYFLDGYGKIEIKLKQKYLHVHEIVFCLSSVKEENDLLAQSMVYHYDDRLEKIYQVEGVRNLTGRILYSLQGYKLEQRKLCDDFRNKWISESKIKNEKFDFSLLNTEADAVIYKDIRAKSIIFCQGAFASENPYFKELPVIPNKGQYLVVDTLDWKNDKTIKDQIIITEKDGYQWVGATYEWQYKTAEPTLQAKEFLLNKLNSLLDIPFTIMEHHIGLRPTTQNRRPIIAQNEHYPVLWAINGLGTKGASICPYLINHFLDIYEGKAENNFKT